MFTGIQFSGYKLFCNETMTELDKITNVNVIIGKNNSGKSSLLDVIEMAYNEDSFNKQKRQIGLLRVLLPMTRNMVQRIFSGYSRIGGWNATNYWEKVEGKNALIELGGTKDSQNLSGYRVIKTNDLYGINPTYFQSGLNDFECEKRKYIFKIYI